MTPCSLPAAMRQLRKMGPIFSLPTSFETRTSTSVPPAELAIAVHASWAMTSWVGLAAPKKPSYSKSLAEICT
jgi:hypothetical protein